MSAGHLERPQSFAPDTPEAPPPVAAAPPAAVKCKPAQAPHSDAEAAALVNSDFAALAADSKAQALYISIGHLAEGNSECDLDFYRFGVGQLMNMMSRAADIVPTHFIDAEDSIARFDLRELGWTPDSLGYLMVASEGRDYGVIPGVVEGAVAVRADWLVSNLTSPQVYGYVMDNQLLERMIEAQAGVDPSKPGQFGGVYTSSIANNPRLLERRESEHGACWISHDFLYRPQAMEAMQTGVLPQDDLRFALQVYIAREYICTLPNGLHTYDVTGFVSQRRWDVPRCVAENHTREDGWVVNGQCFNCHGTGLIPFQDKVRAEHPNPTEHIKARFPEQSELDDIFARDQAVFQEAFAKISYYDPSYGTPLNEMIDLYLERTKKLQSWVSSGTFAAFLPKGGTGGPAWEYLVNPILDLAVDMGILLPVGFLMQDIPEKIIPEFKKKYAEKGLDEESCYSF
ncbi:MAG: hypothetical protein ABW252_12535 [Polyangiales bacterium]